MKNKDLDFIKKKYGESFARFCRSEFSTILEEEGLLSKIINDNFNSNKFLYQDIVSSELEYEFKSYIYSFVPKSDDYLAQTNKTPQELMKKVGYNLYKCETDEDVKSFIKYYTPLEVLCTFRDEDRINTHHIFFAVKEDVYKIRREDFKNPLRQDEYGTSVISLQFTKEEPNDLSIKNRYNHSVANCDSTFSNDLENITAGLTQSFEKTYNLNLSKESSQLEIPGYVRAKDKKFYKYNYEINGVYYCPDNILINEKKEVINYDKNKFLLLDYFLLDLENKTLTLPDANFLQDSFINDFNSMDTHTKISVSKDGNNKVISVKKENQENITITLNNKNKILKYSNANITRVEDNFLQYNEVLDELHLPAIKKVGDGFLTENIDLKEVDFSKVSYIGNDCLSNNKAIESLNLSNATYIGDKFLHRNKRIKNLDLPSALYIGNYFMSGNIKLKHLTAPNVKYVGVNFLWSNKFLKELNLPNAEHIGKMFLYNNNSLTNLNLPKATHIGYNFLRTNKTLTNLVLSNVSHIGSNFMYDHPNFKQFYEQAKQQPQMDR